MNVDCTLMAQVAAPDALARGRVKRWGKDHMPIDVYCGDMTLGNRTAMVHCDARLVDILPPEVDREAWLTREFLACAEALAAADQA